MGSKVRLSRFALTKIITISPFYLLYNRTKVGDALLANPVGRSDSDTSSLFITATSLYLHRTTSHYWSRDWSKKVS